VEPLPQFSVAKPTGLSVWTFPRISEKPVRYVYLGLDVFDVVDIWVILFIFVISLVYFHICIVISMLGCDRAGERCYDHTVILMLGCDHAGERCYDHTVILMLGCNHAGERCYNHTVILMLGCDRAGERC